MVNIIDGILRLIDLGGSGARRADWVNGKIINYRRIGRVSCLSELVEFASQDIMSGCIGIAFAAAGVVTDNSIISNTPNCPFLDQVNLAEAVNRSVRLPVFVFNDMEAAATGMATLVPLLRYFLAITWSTGIGVRIVLNGEVISDSEGGHMVIDASSFAPKCGCGLRGDIEGIASGSAIARRVLETAQRQNLVIPSDMDPCAFLDAEYGRGVSWARDEYSMVAKAIGLYLANVQILLHVPSIVWKGSVAVNALPFLENEILAEIESRISIPSWARAPHLRFMMSPNPEHDSLIGAATLFMRLQQQKKLAL